MFLTLWEFEVKSGCEELFEQAYGPEGVWVKLFRRDARYRETRLLRDAGRERVHVTMDWWESRIAYERFRKKWAKEYAETDRRCESLTISERLLASSPSISSRVRKKIAEQAS